MKKTTALLLTVILLFTLVSCNGIQNRTNNNKENTGVTGIQNFYSGVTDISEVRSYFKKSLGMDINDLYCFRYYEIINVIDYQEILLQIKRYDNSSYEYMIYYNGSVQGYLNDVCPGEVIPLSEKPNSQLSNKKYQVSELTFDTTPRESHIKPISIITDIEEKVIRIIESDVSVYTIEYNKDHTISAISHFINYYDLTKHLFSDDDLYDAEHCFEEDNADGYVKQIYNYNTDGSASQVDNYDHSLAVNAFDAPVSVDNDVPLGLITNDTFFAPE